MEIWKKIPMSDYEISDEGRLRSTDHVTIRSSGMRLPIKGKVIKPCEDTKGYYRYRFAIDGHQQTKKIHRLVCEAFHENINKYAQVNHIDGNAKNNRADNLEWCSNEQNAAHAVRIGLSKNRGRAGLRHHQAKLTAKDVQHIRDEYDRIGRNLSAQQKIAKGYGISPTTVRGLVFQKKHWSLRGSL